jgi:hypothetical protein
MTVIYHTISLTVMTLDQREGENFAYFASFGEPLLITNISTGPCPAHRHLLQAMAKAHHTSTLLR